MGSLKKRKERERRVAREKQWKRQRQVYFEKYPAMRLVSHDGPAEVVEMVASAIRRFRLDDPVWFDEGKQYLLRIMRERGFGAVIQGLMRGGSTR